MTRFFTLACIAVTLCTSISASAQKQHVPPPGTIHLKDNLYIDKAPVSNIAYREFLYALQSFWSLNTHATMDSMPMFGLKPGDKEGIYITDQKGTVFLDSANSVADGELYQSMQIPESLIVDPATNLTMEYYNKSRAFDNYPVVYVTYAQAEMYCKWRTDWVMLQYAMQSGSMAERRKYHSKITYRLANENEWKDAYENKAELMLSDFGTRSTMKKTLTNYKPVDSRTREANFSIYANNFAEMLLEKKSMIGVLWNTATEDKNNVVTQSYAPASNVGFRCVCEVMD